MINLCHLQLGKLRLWTFRTASLGITCAVFMGCTATIDDTQTDDSDALTDRQCNNTTSPDELARCVHRAAYDHDLRTIAGRRPSGSPHWKDVQKFCERRLRALGFDVELHNYGTGTNVIGRRIGTTVPDEQVLVSAHYDSVPGCAGADDNGTGVAGALETARILSKQPFDRTLVVAFWDQEEQGLLGSTAYAQRATTRNEKIVANHVFEMIGYKDETPGSQQIPPLVAAFFPAKAAELAARGNPGDFIALVADDLSFEAANRFAETAALVDLKVLRLDIPSAFKPHPALADLRRSDHASFWAAGFPGMMLTDTANYRNPGYHCMNGERDTVRKLDTPFAVQVIGATVGAAARMLTPFTP